MSKKPQFRPKIESLEGRRLMAGDLAFESAEADGVDLPNGKYFVNVTLGDATFESVAKDEKITISGGRTESVSEGTSNTLPVDKYFADLGDDAADNLDDGTYFIGVSSVGNEN